MSVEEGSERRSSSPPKTTSERSGVSPTPVFPTTGWISIREPGGRTTCFDWKDAELGEFSMVYEDANIRKGYYNSRFTRLDG